MTDVVTLKYLALPHGLAGRGGGVRFFLRAAGIPHKEDLVPMGEWFAKDKAAELATGRNPLGVLPVVSAGGKSLVQHISTVRYLARGKGLYGLDADADQAADGVAEQYGPWRDAWASSLSADDAGKAAYAAARAKYYDSLEALLGYYGASGASAVAGGKLTVADPLLFALLWDDTRTSGSTELLESHPKLLAFYGAFKKLPAIAEWVEYAAS